MKIVVAGAGYAGTLAANRLAKKVPEAEITVVNPRPDFVERVRLHQHVVGTGKVATPLTEMLRGGVRARLAAVGKIGDGGVALETGESVDFDYLVLAVGSTVSPLPGTVPVGTWEGAESARATLASLPPGAAVTVIGSGATGIETAAEVADGRPDLRVRLVGHRLAATFSDGARRRVRAGLDRLKVSVLEGAVVTEVLCGQGENGADKVRLRAHPDGAAHGVTNDDPTDGLADDSTDHPNGELSSDLTLWAVLGTVPDLAARSGLEVDDRGRAVVDPYLRSVSDPRIFAVGDCAAVPGSRAACQTAGPQGAHAADTLARTIRGRKLKPYSMGYFGTGLTLGRQDGVIQLSRRDDSARRQYLAGRPAVVVKEGATSGARYGSRTATIAWLSGPK
ncbi:NAD(P)/FAD-dependent oxidoreductase [Streptomyces aureocirculatus]|uniref:NAD(P)/FAD-dependent oxidoreductase n=1 Tax=Streptomyces aureocirculatus TaxID=67275 RepID=UPI0004C9316A|nr:FAD-dependent oxidoreductase [Streptomyces aureocirculatus]